MPEPRLRVFPGGGMAKIIDPGGPGKPAVFEVEWRNPSTERVQETKAFWESVGGYVDPFWFKCAGTRYEPCHFEPHSLKYEAVGRDHRLIVRFRATKAAERKGD
jgi:hypothetical protein